MTPKQRDIKKYLNITDIRGTFQRLLKIVYSRMFPISEEGLNKLLAVMLTEESIEEITNAYIPLYAKHFTHNEIKDLIKFQQSSLGKKYFGAVAQITVDADFIGSEWANRIMARHGAEIEEILNEEAERLDSELKESKELNDDLRSLLQ